MAKLEALPVPQSPAEVIERLWEGAHPYDGYEVDSKILQHRHELGDYALLLDDRYNELAANGGGADAHRRNSQRSTHNKLQRVTQEWTRHYLLPRVAKVDESEYDRWAVAHTLAVGPENIKPLYRDVPKPDYRNFYLAVAPIDLVPLTGSFLHIVAPPNIPVTGDRVYTAVYSWDHLGTTPDPLNIVELYPSTQKALADSGFPELVPPENPPGNDCF
jgi:hypothetical protein